MIAEHSGEEDESKKPSKVGNLRRERELAHTGAHGVSIYVYDTSITSITPIAADQI
jgi:hypothetical protein